MENDVVAIERGGGFACFQVEFQLHGLGVQPAFAVQQIVVFRCPVDAYFQVARRGRSPRVWTEFV